MEFRESVVCPGPGKLLASLSINSRAVIRSSVLRETEEGKNVVLRGLESVAGVHGTHANG